MTYRRLFLWLLAGSTLMLAGVWWFSMKNFSSFAWSQRAGGAVISGHFYSATVTLLVISEEPGSSINFRHISSRPANKIYAPLLSHYRPAGNFHWESENHRLAPHRRYLLEFPVWMAWLLFVGTAFTAYRWLERRSLSGEEKKLADGNAVDSFQGDAP